MKIADFNRYNYAELLKKATSSNATQAEIDTLGAWFEEYGTSYWNGEYYDAVELRLFPVYEQDGDDFTVACYKFN